MKLVAFFGLVTLVLAVAGILGITGLVDMDEKLAPALLFGAVAFGFLTGHLCCDPSKPV